MTDYDRDPIRVHRAAAADMPPLEPGEIGWETDKEQLVIGTAGGNVKPNVLKSLYDAYTILMATADDTPTALTVTEQTLVGRLTGAAIAAIAIGIADNNIMQVDGSPADNEWGRWTANGMEGRTDAEVISDLGGLARIETGTYTGNGSTGQVVSLAASWTPIMVETMASVSAGSYFVPFERWDNHGANLSAYVVDGLMYADKITSFSAGSFTVDDAGLDKHPNKNGVSYIYLAVG